MENDFHNNYCEKLRYLLRAIIQHFFKSINTDLKHTLKTLNRHYVNTAEIIKGHEPSFVPSNVYTCLNGGIKEIQRDVA